MNNQLNNDQDGKRLTNKDPRQGSGKESSVDSGFSDMPPGHTGVLRVVYQYAEG